MANNPEPIEVSIVARIQGLLDGLNTGTSAVKNATGEMQGAFGKLESVIGNIKAPFLALSAALGGGAIFKSCVDETLKWNGEAMKLSRTLGITTQEASVLNLALGDIYTDSQTYIGAVQMMTRQLNSGGAGFKKLGIETKDSSGHLKSSSELMTETLTKLNEMKAGTDRNAAGMAIFGRSWGEATKLLKLNAEVMAEARQKAERLHLIVGPEGVAMTKAYKAAMNDVEDCFQSLKVQVGNMVLPILVKLGTWMGENGPGLCDAFGVGLKSLITVFYAIKAVIETVTIIITGFFQNIYSGVAAFASVINRVVHGDFKGAWQEAQNGGKEIQASHEAAAEGVKQAWQNMAQSTKDLWHPKTQAPSKVEQTGATFNPGDGSKKTQMQKWEEELSQAKAVIEENSNYLSTMGQESEMKFWQGKLSVAKAGSDDAIAIIHKLSTLAQAIEKERTAAAEKAEKERQALTKETTKGQIAEAQRQLEAEKETLAHRVAMGQITAAERVSLEKSFVDRAVVLELRAVEDEMKGLQKGTAEYQRAENQKTALAAKGAAQRIALNNQEKEKELAAYRAVVNGMTSNWEKGISAMLRGTLSFQKGIQKAFQGIGQYIEQTCIKAGLDWARGEATKTLATLMGNKTRVTDDETSALKSLALYAASAIKQIAISAYKAAAGAYSALVSIPYVGPFIAPAAAGLALAAVIGFGSRIASASGGWDRVPSDQVAQIHKDEMVLPAHLAQGVRDMTTNGGSGGASGGGLTLNVSAMDAKSFHNYLRSNQTALAKVMGEMSRNGRKA